MSTKKGWELEDSVLIGWNGWLMESFIPYTKSVIHCKFLQ
jgi:hypothetical protein